MGYGKFKKSLRGSKLLNQLCTRYCLNSYQYNIQSLKVIYKLIVWNNFLFLFDHFIEISLHRVATGDQVW